MNFLLSSQFNTFRTPLIYLFYQLVVDSFPQCVYHKSLTQRANVPEHDKEKQKHVPGSIDTMPFSIVICRLLDTFSFKSRLCTHIYQLPYFADLFLNFFIIPHTQPCQQTPFQYLPTMAEAFLRQLLRVENSVQEQPNGSGQCCIICYTEYGTLCEETGTMEVEIRLPCKHKVGSRCIAKWLDSTGNAKNQCPVCRYVFFPAEPRPYLEHGIIGDYEGSPLDTPEGSPLAAPEGFGGYIVHDTGDDDEQVTEEDTEETGSNLETIKNACVTFCYRLNLNTHFRAIEVSQRLAQHILEETAVADRPGDFSMASIAAVSVFATSHLIGAPKIQEWVSMNSGVSIGAIAGLYWYVTHPHDFGDLIDEEMLAMINRGDRETILGFLPEAH